MFKSIVCKIVAILSWRQFVNTLTAFDADTKWLVFRRRHCQTYFLQCKNLDLDSSFTEVCYYLLSPINNIPALDLSLDQIMAWSCAGDKPLFEPMLIRLLTHICITRPQWVKPIQWMFSQHYGYWWPGALAPGHHWLQCWVCTHAFPVV